MQIVSVGSQGLVASRLALGCMGMSEFYVGSSTAECQATIRQAIEQGVTMFDTADMYGPFTNECFVGSILKSYRSEVAIATKFGYVRLPDGTRLGLSGHPEYVKRACEASLRRLNTDYIDLYYLHRVDKTIAIEDTIGAMADLVRQGKVRYLGLSEVSCQTLRVAHAVFPISAVQSEYSLFSRDPEFEIFETLQDLRVGFIAYAPLGRGLLTGRFRTIDDVPLDDYRRTTPRFSADNLSHNASLVETLGHVAREVGATPAQLALAWVQQKIGDNVAVVGTTSRSRLSENVASLTVDLATRHIATLDLVFHRDAAHGLRYADMSRVNG